MKKLLIIIAVAFIMHHNANAQSSFDPTWAARFQAVLDSVVTADNIIGATAAAMAPGEGIWSGISGNSMPGVPLTSEMRFGIGSNTKLFISVTMMKLQEEGLLSLDDHLYQWLPSYSYIDSSITIRQLLSHQSGIYNYTDNTSFWNEVYADTAHFWTPQEILGYIWLPKFAPGTGWRYSNTNYILACMIIEAATGKTWVQNLHEIIFDPLNMDSTFVGAYEPPNGPVAGTQWWDGGPWCIYPVTSWFTAVGPAGAILSTSQEMVQWYNALINGEIISDSSLQQILDFEAASLFGLGIYGDADVSLRYPWYTHTGWMQTYVSQIIFDIQTHSVFCIMSNVVPASLSMRNFTTPMMHVLYSEYPKKQNDAGITRIINPGEHVCTDTVSPLLILKNFGSDPLTTVSIHCKKDAGTPSNFTWTGNLSPNDTIMVPLESMNSSNGLNTLTVYTTAPNNASDGYLYNDTVTVHFIANLLPVATIPLVEDFEDPVFPPEGWISVPDALIQWGRTKLTALSGIACAVKCNYFDDHIGAIYYLDLPMLDIGTLNNLTLDFTYAYAYLAGVNSYDSLKILISSDCGTTWQTLFYDGGYSLATAPAAWDAFFPKSNEWSQQTVSLAGYSGNVLIRFQDICGFANNLFIDDIHVGWPAGTSDLPSNASFIRVFPNPFNDHTRFEYTLDEPASVCLTVYNNLGQQVGIMVNEKQPEGKNRVQWNAEGLPVGMYYYRIQAGKQVGSGKLVKN
jgi:CubicO group peptidase (beta-lactamase class C family)